MVVQRLIYTEIAFIFKVTVIDRAQNESLFLPWLRYIIWMFEKENGNLFIRFFTDVDTAVDPVRWLIPIDLPGRDVEALTFTPIAIFDGDCGPLQNDSHSMERVTMPGHDLSWFEMQTPNKRVITSD